MGTLKIDKSYKINFDVLKGGAINKQGFSYSWFYRENDNNVYLMEKDNRITKIYKINIYKHEISEIFQTNLSPINYFSNFFIEGNNLYLMNFNEEKSNYEHNYIILHNLSNKDEKIII